MTSRHEQIQSIVESTLNEASTWDALSYGAELGGTDLMGGELAASRELAAISSQKYNKTGSISNRYLALPDAAKKAINDREAQLIAAIKRPGMRRTGRATGALYRGGKRLGKYGLAATAFAVGQHVISNMMDRYTQGYGGIGLEKGREPQVTELPDFGLNIK